jgi:hypothetical protein
MRIKYLKWFLIIFSFFYSHFALAKIRPGESFGDLANDLLGPVTVISDFVGTAAWIVGFSCLFASLFRYLQYRVNPLASPISTVIVLLVLGILLLCLPFTYLLTGTGIPFPP